MQRDTVSLTIVRLLTCATWLRKRWIDRDHDSGYVRRHTRQNCAWKILTGKLIKNWIVRDLGEGKNQPAHRILRGHFSGKTYLLFRFSIILRYFLTSEKSKHGPRVLFAEIKGLDRPMQGLP